RPVPPPALVHAADVEARGHRHTRAQRSETLGEFQRRVAEIDRAVDMRVRDVHQAVGAVDLRHRYDDGQRGLGGRPVLATQHRALGIGQFQLRFQILIGQFTIYTYLFPRILAMKQRLWLTLAVSIIPLTGAAGRTAPQNTGANTAQSSPQPATTILRPA